MSALVDFLASRYSPSRMISKLDIASSTWSQIRRGTRVPTPRILSSMQSGYKGIQYNRLSRAGFSDSLSNMLKNRSVDDVDNYISRMNSITMKIAVKRETDIYAIKRAMRQSDKSFEELERRVHSDESP